MGNHRRRRFRDGKKLETWSVRGDSGEHKVLVYFLSGGEYNEGPHFRAVCDELGLDVKDSDIARLRTKARTEAVKLSKRVWTPMLFVCVKATSGRNGGYFHPDKIPDNLEHLLTTEHGHELTLRHAEIRFVVERYDFTTIKGETYYRNPDCRDVSWPLEHREQRWSEGSWIADTPENRAALLKIHNAFLEVARRVHSFVGNGEALERTLRAITNGAPALAPDSLEPDPKPGRVRVRK